MRDILEVTRDLHAGRADRNGAGAARGDSQTRPIPASCSAGSLTVSRKAKKRGPGSSRRKGSPTPQATGRRGVSIQRHLPAAPGAAAQAEASFREDASGVPPAPLAPSDGGSRSVFRTRPSAPGAAREGGGQQGPTAPTREKAAWPGGCGREMEQQVTGGTDRDQGTGIGGGRGGRYLPRPRVAQGTAAQGAHGGDLASGRSVGHPHPQTLFSTAGTSARRAPGNRGALTVGTCLPSCQEPHTWELSLCCGWRRVCTLGPPASPRTPQRQSLYTRPFALGTTPPASAPTNTHPRPQAETAQSTAASGPPRP